MKMEFGMQTESYGAKNRILSENIIDLNLERFKRFSVFSSTPWDVGRGRGSTSSRWDFGTKCPEVAKYS